MSTRTEQAQPFPAPEPDREQQSTALRPLGFLSLIVIVGSALALWELLVSIRQVPSYILPAPTLVLHTLYRNAASYATASLMTLGVALGGLSLGIVVGTGVAITVTFWSRLERGVLALAILIKAIPMVAIAPLLVIWFGFGPLPKVLITALITFFPVMINIHAGLRAVDSAVIALFHSLDAGPWETFLHARWPASLPYLFAALKAAGPLSLVGAVVAEWAGASAGLGRAMWLAYANLNMPALFAAVVCSATMGIVLYALISALEKRIIFWQSAR